MNIKKLSILFSILSFLFVLGLVNIYADSIILKSGKEIQGRISEGTENYVRIDSNGVIVTYLTDEIERIEKDSGESQPKEAGGNDYAAILENQFNKINYYLSIEEYENAANLSKKIIDFYPESDVAYGILGASYYYLGKYTEAKEFTEKAISIKSDGSWYMLLGVICDNLGLSNEAKDYLEKAKVFFQNSQRPEMVFLIKALLKKIK